MFIEHQQYARHYSRESARQTEFLCQGFYAGGNKGEREKERKDDGLWSKEGGTSCWLLLAQEEQNMLMLV